MWHDSNILSICDSIQRVLIHRYLWQRLLTSKKGKAEDTTANCLLSFILTIFMVLSHFMTLVAELCGKVRSVFSIITRYHGSCSHLTSCCTRHDKHIKYIEPINLFMRLRLLVTVVRSVMPTLGDVRPKTYPFAFLININRIERDFEKCTFYALSSPTRTLLLPIARSFIRSLTPFSHSWHFIPSGSELFGYVSPKVFVGCVAWVCKCERYRFREMEAENEFTIEQQMK